MKLYVLFSLIFSVNADIFTPPNCINNYTSFMDQSINYSNDTLIVKYNSIDAVDCARYCNYLDNCSSFNYYPRVTQGNFQSLCELLNLDFNRTFLIRSIDNAYYLKSISDCSSETHNLYVLIAFVILITAFGLICCCLTKVCRRRRNGYHSINP